MKVLGWEERLAAAIERARRTRFAWGKHDCALFAAEVVHELTGNDYAAPYRGYSSEREAWRVVQQAGGLVGIASKIFGPPLTSPLCAQRGDVVQLDSSRRGWDAALGICVGEFVAVPGSSALAFVPMAHWKTAWRV